MFGPLILLLVFGFFCLIMVFGGGGWLWAIAGLGVLAFLLFSVYVGERLPWPPEAGKVQRRGPRAGEEDLDELDDFLDMQDDV